MQKRFAFPRLLLQGIALVTLLFANSTLHFIVISIVLGWGTAMVYPTFLATVAENTHPAERANAFGVFRFWRDLGYAIGAVLTGIIADSFGMNASVLTIGLLTIFSAMIIYYRMKCSDKNFIKIIDWFRNRFSRTQGNPVNS